MKIPEGLILFIATIALFWFILTKGWESLKKIKLPKWGKK